MMAVARLARTASPIRATAPPVGAWTPRWRLAPPPGLTGISGSTHSNLLVSQPTDPLEQEADQVAGQVLRAPSQPGFQPRFGHNFAQIRVLPGASDEGASVTSVPPTVHDVLRSPGQPLDARSRAYFEPRFGHDFSRVRVHADATAAQSARDVNARAYTVVHDIVFGAGGYAPASADGKRLIAHELAHVVQGGPGVVQRDTRHEKGYAGEQAMGFGYRQEKGWIFIEGPSGAGGHGITQPGFDGIAYHIDADELHILDNKALKAATARSASALTTNVLQNLDEAIDAVRAMQDLPRRIKILGHLMKARAALAAGNQLPKNVKLVITGEAGNVRRVGSRLAALGVEFRQSGTLDEPLAPMGPAAQQTHGEIHSPAPKGTPPAVEGHQPTVVVDPSLQQSEHKQPSAPPTTGGAKTPSAPPSPAGEGHAPPVRAPAEPEAGHVTPSASRFRSGIRIVGGAVAAAGVAAALAFFTQWFNEWFLKKQLSDLEPQIEAEVEKHAGIIAELRSRGAAAYANVTVEVAQQTVTDFQSGEPVDVTLPPMAILKSVWVTDKDLNGARDESILATRTDAHQYTYSYKVDISEDRLATFRTLMVLWKSNQAQLLQTPFDPEVQKGEQRLRTLFRLQFGPFAELEVLDAWMWPQFTPKFDKPGTNK